MIINYISLYVTVYGSVYRRLQTITMSSISCVSLFTFAGVGTNCVLALAIVGLAVVFTSSTLVQVYNGGVGIRVLGFRGFMAGVGGGGV